MSVLIAEHLEKSFGGVRAVARVSLRVSAGEIVALIGPNGAGKSTVFNMLAGSVVPDRGRVTFEGRDLTGQSATAFAMAGIARTFQIAALFESMTVRENVQTALIAARRAQWRMIRPARSMFPIEASALLAQAGLAARADDSCAALPYGDRKRLELAIALAGAPRLLLLDEPTAGMAPDQRLPLMRLIAALAVQSATAVLFTEHDMEAVFGTAHRIAVMDRGILIAEGDAAAIRGDLRVREVYLGADQPI